jgi:hypothetical protein
MEGAVVVVEEKSLQRKKMSHEKMKPSAAIGRTKGSAPVRYLG